MLLLRISPASLASIWPVILTELIRPFSSPLTTSASHDTLRVLLSILKVVDLAVLLDVQDFHLHQWMFILESPPDGSTDKPDEDIDENEPLFEPLCGRLAAAVVTGKSAAVVEHSGSSRLPIINVRDVKDAEALARLAGVLNHRGHLDSIECTEIDKEEVIR